MTFIKIMVLAFILEDVSQILMLSINFMSTMKQGKKKTNVISSQSEIAQFCHNKFWVIAHFDISLQQTKINMSESDTVIPASGQHCMTADNQCVTHQRGGQRGRIPVITGHTVTSAISWGADHGTPLRGDPHTHRPVTLYKPHHSPRVSQHLTSRHSAPPTVVRGVKSHQAAPLFLFSTQPRATSDTCALCSLRI
jgi:hypothetical protein